MKKFVQIIFRIRNQRGIAAILVGILILILLGCVAFAVDVGYLMVTRNELQNVSDAASLAATRYIGHTYESLTYEEQQSYNFEKSTIVETAKQVALKNQAAKKNITINDSDVFIGKWDAKTKSLFDIGNMNQPDAVRVVARRDGAANGPIATVFGKVLGKDTFNVTAKATAALTGESTAAEGGLPPPIGISQVLADRSGDGWCGARVKMHPTRDSCAGWHTFTSKTHSSSQLEQILQDMLPPSMRDKKYAGDQNFISPEVKINNTLINFTGGDLASNFINFENLFNYMKTRDGDGDDNIWTTAIVIYKENAIECGNPTGDTEIVGFATMKISIVLGPSDKEIWGEIICNYVDTGRGGGGEYGTLGSIPGLVQ
jgi:Flp pilus assembly protein TadG